MKLRNKLIATIVSISMVLAVIGVGAWASTESFTATITNTVNLEFDNLKGIIYAEAHTESDNPSEGTIFPSMGVEEDVVMYDGSSVKYDQISSAATGGTNLYWEGTKFLDSSEDGLAMVTNETKAAYINYIFYYIPTDDCTGTSTITVMVDETSLPAMEGGTLLVKYFASADGMSISEIKEGVPISPINDNEGLLIAATCQYHNPNGVSVSMLDAEWNFNISFSAGRATKSELDEFVELNDFMNDGIMIPLDYDGNNKSEVVGPEGPWEIIEFGEYPQTLKANNVTITSTTPDADGYYPGSDGERYAKRIAVVDEISSYYKMNVFSNGTTFNNGEEYYFKVEPIKWRALDNGDGTYSVASHMVIDTQPYQTKDPVEAYGAPEGTWRNNYEYSEMRRFLNGEFYNKAFSESEQAKIPGSTDLGDGRDKIWLLSKSELAGLDEMLGADPQHSEIRCWFATDYAKAGGVWILSPELRAIRGDKDEVVSFEGSTWNVFTSTPSDMYEYVVCVSYLGTFGSTLDTGGSVSGAGIGIAPAMSITK